MNEANPDLIRQMRERMNLGNNNPSSSGDQPKENN